MNVIASYEYSEVSTFGGHGDDFVLVVCPCQKRPPDAGNLLKSEKLLLAMPKLKVQRIIE